MYLLDTNILSAGSLAARVPFAALVEWLDLASDALFLSTVTGAEIVDGIEKNEREGANRKAALLRAWWETVEHLYADRILPFDIRAARIAGKLLDRARGEGLDPSFADIAIAATAEAHDLSVLTRNIKDFAPLGVACINPHDGLPALPKRELSRKQTGPAMRPGGGAP
ncbi:type II toxin-antitoxin system VapC family toxin [Jiella mangrovi]|uniref:Ribonuclease VapC n=1 Tax=Jiella mangrovi TaxID=2821407 RepID=A0ABS4BHI4_9HYPH|nr:type II toxin-antitoxin system VapC family toxin [Jiella mangrovi]